MVDFNKKIAANGDDARANTDGSNWFDNTTVGIGNQSGNAYHAFFRFTNVTIPSGATIDTCVLRFTAEGATQADTVRVKLHFEDADDPAAPTNGTDLIGRSLTTGQDWDFTTNWSDESTYDTADFATELQTVINRSGWASGQDVIAHVVDDGSDSNAFRQMHARNFSSTKCAELRVTYTPPPQPSVDDDVAVTESTAIELEFIGEVQNAETIALTESADVGLDKLVSGLDQIAVTESFDVDIYDLWFYPQVADNIGIAENVNIEFGLLYPQGGDDIGISESVGVLLELPGISVADNVAITEFIGFPIYNETAEAMTIGDTVEAFNWSVWFAANKNKAIPRYYLTLTGDADDTTDIQLPISSLQARKRTGSPTYISAVVPGFDYAAQISARANGELVITIGYEIDGTVEFTEEILRATLEEIRTDEGPVNRAISLSGNKTQTFATQIATLENSIYRSIQSGNIVHRFGHIDPWLNPGDTCRIDADEFTVDYIVYMVNAQQTIMEVREG